MKKIFFVLQLILVVLTSICSNVSAQSNDLRVVFIRHGEKPPIGDNLTCQGLNRALKLPAILVPKFGVPSYIMVPSLGLGEATKHSRMFQTVIPLAAKYNLKIDSSHPEVDSLRIASEIKQKKGTILIIWEHKGIAPIVRSLGVVSSNLSWADNDYDSIWIVSYKNGVPTITFDKENIIPLANCDF